MHLNSAVTAISSPVFNILNLTPLIGPLSPSLCVAYSEAGVLKKLRLAGLAKLSRLRYG